jgi:hypothetical protein
VHRLGPTFVAIAVLSAGGIRAQEASKPSADQPPESSIATAKKSFASLSKKYPTEERGTLEMPTLAAPEFNLGTPTALESPKNKTAKPSGNWLVDGVSAAPAGKDHHSSSVEQRRFDALTSKNGSGLEAQEITALSDGEEISNAQNRPSSRMRETAKQLPESVNPLASYMPRWVSAQDRALLLPSKIQDFSAANLDDSLINFSGASSVSAASPGESAGLTPTALKDPVLDNPYLRSTAFNAPTLVSEVAVSGNFRSLIPVAAKPLDSALHGPMIDAPTQTATKSSPRDLAKPEDGAKYFKQLKRF